MPDRKAQTRLCFIISPDSARTQSFLTGKYTLMRPKGIGGSIESNHQVIFNPSWICRAGPALLIRPALGEMAPDDVKVVIKGRPKFARLSRLKNSARN